MAISKVPGDFLRLRLERRLNISAGVITIGLISSGEGEGKMDSRRIVRGCSIGLIGQNFHSWKHKKTRYFLLVIPVLEFHPFLYSYLRLSDKLKLESTLSRPPNIIMSRNHTVDKTILSLEDVIRDFHTNHTISISRDLTLLQRIFQHLKTFPNPSGIARYCSKTIFAYSDEEASSSLPSLNSICRPFPSPNTPGFNDAFKPCAFALKRHLSGLHPHSHHFHAPAYPFYVLYSLQMGFQNLARFLS